MNGLEKQYAEHLRGLQFSGDLLGYWFDAVKLRLAEKTFYTPDFLVQKADLSLEIHEVKGFWEDDARVKIKVAANQFPFQFVAVQKQKGVWVYENF